MPALGAFNAFDAQQYPFGDYEHVMEPTAAFPGTLSEAMAIQYLHDGGYSHPMEAMADFGDTFTAVIFGPW